MSLAKRWTTWISVSREWSGYCAIVLPDQAEKILRIGCLMFLDAISQMGGAAL